VRAGVFLDRDGTVNREVGYLADPNQIELIPGAARAIRLLNMMALPVIVISNQSGVGRGYVTHAAVEKANRRLEGLLVQEGARVDKIYYCPHSPDDGCTCRKPEPGLLHEAERTLGIELPLSYMVGDHAADVKTIHRVGGKGILVLTGHGQEQAEWNEAPPDFVAQDLLEAVYWIVREHEKERECRMAISEELLEILACPKCKGEVVLSKKGDGLICKACKCLYPIKDDIPVMLIDEAIPYEEKSG